MPAVVEAAAYAYPGVRDCAAFAAPDRARPEASGPCWLAVVAAEDLDRDAFARHLAAQPGLPPARLAWIDEIPRNPMGQVQRGKLRDLLRTALAQG